MCNFIKFLSLWLKRRRSFCDYSALQRFRAKNLRTKLLRKCGPELRILDIGCHRGGYANELSKSFHVFGAEIDFNKIKTAQKDKAKDETNARFISADATELPFKENIFDFILLSNIIEHVTNPDKLIRECYRVLKSGAFVYVQYPPYLSILGGHFYHKSFALPLPLQYLPKQLTNFFCKQENIQKLTVHKLLKILGRGGFKVKEYYSLPSRIPLINEIWPLFEVVLKK